MMLFFSTMLLADANECAMVETLPDAVQVAWISPTTTTVRSSQMIEVVHLQALQQWIGEEEADAKSVLHHMGMLSKRSKKTIDPADYKITIFDVETSSLCRPIVTTDTNNVSEDLEAVIVEGISVCEQSSRPAARYARYGYTGCGYTQNTQAQIRGIDVYRIPWSEASVWGFCVLPLSRFLLGAPK